MCSSTILRSRPKILSHLIPRLELSAVDLRDTPTQGWAGVHRCGPRLLPPRSAASRLLRSRFTQCGARSPQLWGSKSGSVVLSCDPRAHPGATLDPETSALDLRHSPAQGSVCSPHLRLHPCASAQGSSVTEARLRSHEEHPSSCRPLPVTGRPVLSSELQSPWQAPVHPPQAGRLKDK
ncbi:hypothetical protein NDU88_006751 [Pleurodeles waltl]|uniref:Uncharacterized protein n=1 Tax=Pleurodeles waltl TaxID=8319 RepID=A0AAV7SQJ2_PLEWA|nr:hypothetical protein NDU88_006751 [Pleurodeles waltl]